MFLIFCKKPKNFLGTVAERERDGGKKVIDSKRKLDSKSPPWRGSGL